MQVLVGHSARVHDGANTVCAPPELRWVLQVVFHGGEAADALFVVERGVVAGGGALHGPGAVLGLDLAMLAHGHSAAAATMCDLKGALSKTQHLHSFVTGNMPWGLFLLLAPAGLHNLTGPALQESSPGWHGGRRAMGPHQSHSHLCQFAHTEAHCLSKARHATLPKRIFSCTECNDWQISMLHVDTNTFQLCAPNVNVVGLVALQLMLHLEWLEWNLPDISLGDASARV